MEPEEKYTIVYHPFVARDSARLDPFWRQEVKRVIEEKLLTKPDLYGAPLRQTLRGYRKLRVGDYRIVYRIVGTTVRVLGIIQRSGGYKEIGKRL